jgi:hypothetical protein
MIVDAKNQYLSGTVQKKQKNNSMAQQGYNYRFLRMLEIGPIC